MLYQLNFDVIRDHGYPQYIDDLTYSIENNGYYTVGDFLLNLDDKSLEDLADHLSINNDDMISQNVLLTCLLSVGESIDISYEDDDDFDKGGDVALQRLTLLTKYALFESLARKGYLIAYYDAWTLDLDDDSGRPVVEAIGDSGITEILKSVWGNKNGE